MKVYRKKLYYPGVWVIQCPICGQILASASEKEYLPEFSSCENFEK